jgi:hypothetical protein
MITVMVVIRRAINRCTFDQARLIRHNQILAANGIAPDGKLPLSSPYLLFPVCSLSASSLLPQCALPIIFSRKLCRADADLCSLLSAPSLDFTLREYEPPDNGTADLILYGSVGVILWL